MQRLSKTPPCGAAGLLLNFDCSCACSELFSPIQTVTPAPVSPALTAGPALDMATSGKMVYHTPVNDNHSLIVSWVLPSLHDKWRSLYVAQRGLPELQSSRMLAFAISL